jgi:hypothetical protein
MTNLGNERKKDARKWVSMDSMDCALGQEFFKSYIARHDGSRFPRLNQPIHGNSRGVSRLSEAIS